MRLGGVVLVLVSSLFFYSCQNKRPISPSENLEKANQLEQLYKVNQYLVRQDAIAIRSEAARRNWNLRETGTGLFYEIIETARASLESESDITVGYEVTLDFTVSLLDGTLCYSSDKSGPKIFRVGKSQAESGLHEAVQLLHEGDSARIILPPHLGFGMVGDGDKIPPRSILLYLIKIRSVAMTGNS